MVASNHYDRLTVKLPIPWHVDVVEIPQLPDGSGRWSAVCTFEAKVGAAEWPCLWLWAVLKLYVLVVNCWVTLVIDTNIHIWSYMIGVYFWFFRLNYYRSFVVEFCSPKNQVIAPFFQNLYRPATMGLYPLYRCKRGALPMLTKGQM